MASLNVFSHTVFVQEPCALLFLMAKGLSAMDCFQAGLKPSIRKHAPLQLFIWANNDSSEWSLGRSLMKIRRYYLKAVYFFTDLSRLNFYLTS